MRKRSGYAVAIEDAAVDVRLLAADDLDPLEAVAQAGALDLGLLVEQVTLRDDHERVGYGEGVEGFLDAVEQADRRGEHGAAEVEDAPDLVAGDASFGQLHGGLDHGQHECLDAVAVVLEVAHLGLIEAFLDPLLVVVAGEQSTELPFGRAEEALVVPERVVRVEGDDVDHLRVAVW